MTTGLRYPPFVRPGERGLSSRPAAPEQSEQLPSIDQFIDELPLIDDFLALEPEPVVASHYENRHEVFAPEPPVQAPRARVASEEGWADGAWQSYDWGSLAALNRHEPAGALEAWGATEWPGQPTAMGNQHGGTPSADEIADALDGIARRLRSGELMIDNLSGTPPEAAMAAALAVLLKMRG